MNRRILFITERYPPDMGGVATSAGRIVHALGEIGLDVDVIAWTRTLQPGVVVQQPGVVVPQKGAPFVYRVGRFRGWDTTLPHTMNLVDWLLSRQPYDIIWGHYLAPAGFAAAWIGKLKAIPSVVSIRGNDLDRDMFPPGDFARLIWTLQNAGCITAVTRELCAKVRALCGREDAVWLTNAVDHEVFRPGVCDAGVCDAGVCDAGVCDASWRERLGIRSDEAVLGFAGELREKKGQQYLLQALQKVRETRPACLLIIGEVRPSETAKVMQWMGAGSLEEKRVLVTGQLMTAEDVNRHLQLCDVYLQPSLWDGMPNALLEAMAAGCGCIGSDAGGIPEAITAGVDGVIVPRWQLHRLGEAVLEWLDADAEYRMRVRRAARERVVAEFSFAGERARLRDLLDHRVKS